jgi:hypothetical protein
VTGSIPASDRNALKAIAGEDGEFDDDDEAPGWPRALPGKPKAAAVPADDRGSRNY